MATPVIEATAAAREPYGCLGCRLVQAPTRECVECGAAMVGPLAGLRELMSYPDMNLVAERDMWMISALLAGGSIVMPFLLPVSLVTLGAWVVQLHRRRRERVEQPIAAIADVRPGPAAEAVEVQGVARALRAQTRRPWDGGACLAAELTVRWIGGLFLRATATTPFVIAAAGGDVVVCGVVRFAPAAVAYRLAGRPEVSGAEPRLAALGVPATWRFAGLVHVDDIVEGARVRVVGVVAEAPVPELAGYREGGVVRVMRGTAAAPVVLEVSAMQQ